MEEAVELYGCYTDLWIAFLMIEDLITKEVTDMENIIVWIWPNLRTYETLNLDIYIDYLETLYHSGWYLLYEISKTYCLEHKLCTKEEINSIETPLILWDKSI